MMKTYEDYIDRLTVFFTSDRFKDDVTLAKTEFFDDAGIMDEESASFEMRMTQFLSWYLFTRGLTGIELTPAQYALQLLDFDISPEERPHFENLANVRHSLFEFQKIRGTDINIRDLFSDKKLVIQDSPISIGFSRSEIFDARLVPLGGEDQYCFLKGFCFHPSDATKFIVAEVKKIRKADPSTHEALMLKLMKMRYKYDQYRHLKLEHVYTNERKVRF